MEVVEFIISFLSHALGEGFWVVGLFGEGLVDEFYSFNGDGDPIEDNAS